MSTIPASPINESAYQLFDRWLEHWQREAHPQPSAGVEPAAAAAPPTQEVGISPVPASPVAAAPLPRRAPSGEESGLAVLQTLTEHLVRTSDPFGPAPSTGAPTSVRTPRVDNERQAGGAILRFPGRVLPTSRPSLTAPWAIPPRAVPGEERLAALASAAAPTPGLVLFSPLPGIRPVLTAGFTVTAACTAVSVAVAWLTPTNTTLAVTAALAILTGLLWSARTRATGTAVTIEDGVLKISQGDNQHQFPLTGIHPPIDVIGEPGHRGWRVLIQRRGMKPYVVNATMVDPVEFTDAIHRFRPRA